MEHFVEFEDVCKYYQTGSVKIAAADHMSFYVDKGEFCIIVGPSGAGKTTLLNILAALDRPTAGEVFLNGKALSDVREGDLAAFRRSHLGFVSRNPTYSARCKCFLLYSLASGSACGAHSGKRRRRASGTPRGRRSAERPPAGIPSARQCVFRSWSALLKTENTGRD